MIYKLHIPTIQYGYIEIDFEGSAEEALEEHNRILNLYNGGFGLSRDDFNSCLDEYLSNETGSMEKYTAMSKEQQMVIQEIKKAFKRIKSKEHGNI